MYDDILNRQVTQEKEIRSLKKRVTELETNSYTADIVYLKTTAHDLERHGRQLNFEAHAIPLAEKEYLITKLKDVAKQ